MYIGIRMSLKSLGSIALVLQRYVHILVEFESLHKHCPPPSPSRKQIYVQPPAYAGMDGC